MKKYIVVIPGWAELNKEMQVETGVKYPSFIEMAGMPLYAHIISEYNKIKEEVEFVIVLQNDAPELKSRYIQSSCIKILRIDSSLSIGDTVLAGLSDIKTGQSLIIHMADTILTPNLDYIEDDVIYIEKRDDLYRWTTVDIDEKGLFKVINDRNFDSENFYDIIFVGALNFSHGADFKNILSELIEKQSIKNNEPLFSAIEQYSTIYPVKGVRPINWNDCGNVDSYYEAIIRFPNLRYFNSLKYDSEFGTITKTSKNISAFRNQLAWFKQVPNELESFLPKIYEMDCGDNPYIKMEILTSSTLSEIFINKRINIGAWNEVAKKIKKIINMFAKYEVKSNAASALAEEMYIVKTRKRIIEYKEINNNAFSMYINFDKDIINLDFILSNLEEFVLRSGLSNINSLTPIHGDFCFSNVLYDSRSRHIKMIDPRGEFGLPGIYGDPDYDIAKLTHSYSGGYDFIISDRFKLLIDGKCIKGCELEFDDYHDKVAKIINNILEIRHHNNLRIRAIETLLFLSMLPLHNDQPNRQLAMQYIGMHSFAKNLREMRMK